MVRQTVKAFEIASEGSQMMKSAGEEKIQVKRDTELKRVYTPGRFSMRSKGPSRTADQFQAQARSSCTKGGNEVHANKDTCPATGRRCLKCGRLNHFASMCRSVVNDRRDKHANAVECEQQTNTHCECQEETFLEDVYFMAAAVRKITESNRRHSHQWNSH